MNPTFKPIKEKRKYEKNTHPLAITEFKVQHQIVDWIQENYPKSIIISIPNEAAYNNATFKKKGVLRGASDLILLNEDKTYFLEVKRPEVIDPETGKKVQTAGKQSESQINFQNKISELNSEHTFYYVIYGIEDLENIL